MRAFELTDVIRTAEIEDGAVLVKLVQPEYEGENESVFVEGDTLINEVELALPAETVEEMGGVTALVPGSMWNLVLVPALDVDPVEYEDLDVEEVEVESDVASDIAAFENEGGVAIPPEATPE